MLGTNGAKLGPTGTPTTATDYRTNLKAIVDAILTQHPDAIVFLQQPIFYSPNTSKKDADYESPSPAILKSYFPEISGLVAGYAASHPNQVFAGDTRRTITSSRTTKPTWPPNMASMARSISIPTPRVPRASENSGPTRWPHISVISRACRYAPIHAITARGNKESDQEYVPNSIPSPKFEQIRIVQTTYRKFCRT